MIKLLLTTTAAMFLSIGVAQSQTAQSQTTTGATASKEAQPQQPNAGTTAVPPNPVAITKWFGQAVDDILTSADRTLDDRSDKERRD